MSSKSIGNIFVSEDGCLGRTSVVKHGINTSGNPISRKFEICSKYRSEKMLPKGVIHQSSSPRSSPVVMVKKKTESCLFCIDFVN